MKIHYILVGAAAMALLASGAHATEQLVNGGFETGNFANWTQTDQVNGSGSFFVQSYGSTTPLSGFPTPTQAGGGTYFAVTDQGGPGSHTISQAFNAIVGGAFTLSFNGYGRDQSGVGPVGEGTDFNANPNQHFEVNFNGSQVYYGILTSGWLNYTFDVGSLIVNGANTVSFTEVDNQSFFNVGLDNISLDSPTGSVPEPSTWAMMLLGFGAIGVSMRRRRRTHSSLQAA